MKCFIGIVVPKEPAERLWSLQTRAGTLFQQRHGHLSFSQGKSPLHIRIVAPFEAGGFGGPEQIRRQLFKIADRFAKFDTSVQSLGSDGARDIFASVSPADELKELQVRIRACLGVGGPTAEFDPKIRLAHNLSDEVFGPIEDAFSSAFYAQKEKGEMPLSIDVDRVHLFRYGTHGEWEMASEHLFS